MWSQLRRDPMMDATAVRWGIIVFLNAGVLAGIMTTLAAGSASRAFDTLLGKAVLAALVWISAAAFLLFGRARERCRVFDLALPIPAAGIWLAHVTALVLLGLIFLVLNAGVLMICLWAFRSPRFGFSGPWEALMGLLLSVPANLVLVVVLMQRSRASLRQIPRTLAGTAYSVLLLGSGLVLTILLMTLPAVAALIPLGLGLYLAYRTCRSLPQAFALTSAKPDAGRDFARADSEGTVVRPAAAREWEAFDRAGPLRSFSLAWLLIRILCFGPSNKRHAGWFFFPYLLLWGFYMSGFLAAWRFMDLPQLSYIVLSSFLLFSYLPAQMPQVQYVECLPISRNRIGAFLFLPTLLLFVAGLEAGAIGAAKVQQARLQIQLGTSPTSLFPPYGEKAPMVRVPAMYGEVSWDGKPEDIVSPWGESHPVREYALYRGSRIAVYSPFSTPEESSPRFVAFQISRAIEAVYGVPIPYQKILDLYLEVSADGTASLPDPDRLLADFPGLNPRGESGLIPALLAVTGIVYVLMASIYMGAWRARVPDSRRKAAYLALAAAAIAATAGQVVLMIAGWLRPHVGAAFLRILIFRFVRALPGGAATLWVLCAFVLLGAYWLFLGRLRRVEAVPERPGAVCS